MTALRIGTRGSPLALRQANYVADRLRPLVASRPVELVKVVTAGDQVRDVPLPQLGGEGVFTREIQRVLLGGDVDIAVHSLKDLPTVPVDGLVLAAVPPRAPVADVLIAPEWRTFDQLPQGAIVATSSLRRSAQVRHRRPDLQIVPIRGNVETRLRRREEMQFAGLILAEAGLERLGLARLITERLDTAWMLPAVGQGALGVECRAVDENTRTLLCQLDDEATRQAATAERAMLRALGGGCQVPIGALAVRQEQDLVLRGAVLSPDGSRRIEASMKGPAVAAEMLGCHLAEQLLCQGAAQLLGVAGRVV